jgi:hypothetical protein
MEKLNKFLSNKYVSTVGIGLNVLLFFATDDKYLKVTSLLSISGFVLGILTRHISNGKDNET